MYKCINSSLLLMDTNNEVARRYIHPTCTNYLIQTVECSSRGIPSSSIASFASYKKQRRWEGELPSQRPAPCFPTWTWVRVKVPVGVGGVRRLAPVDRQSTLGPGDVWRQSSGRLRGEGTSCEAICSDRADRRSARTQHGDVLYSPFFFRGGTDPFDCTWSLLYFIDLTIFATVFLLSLILCFGCLGRVREGGWERLKIYPHLAVFLIPLDLCELLLICFLADRLMRRSISFSCRCGKQKAIPSAAS